MDFPQGSSLGGFLYTGCLFYKETVGILRETNSIGIAARHFRQKVDSAHCHSLLQY
jgi:hypothetical protein